MDKRAIGRQKYTKYKINNNSQKTSGARLLRGERSPTPSLTCGPAPWLPRNLKNVQIETTKRFSVGKTKVNILALTAGSKNKFRLSSDNFVKLCTRS